MAMPSPTEADESVYAAAFEVRHECIVGNLSREHPDLRILHWCLSNRDIFQVSGPRDQIESFQRAVDGVFGLRHRSVLPDGALFLTRGCPCGPHGAHPVPSISQAVQEVGAWDIPPIIYRNGWESWRILAWDERSVRTLFRQIRERGEVRINSLRPIDNSRMEQMMLMPASDVFSGLTDRQLSALMLGLENGYYSLSRETKVERLAHGAGLAPSTFGEHLRKAETRILKNLRPYLQAYATRTPGEPVIGQVRPVSRRAGKKKATDAAHG